MTELIAWLRFVVFDVEKEESSMPEFFMFV